jgi:parvulin-like peptidyl-prolyl isomerase
MPGRITFRQVYFSPDKRGARTHAEAQAALAQLLDRAAPVPAPAGDAFFDRDYYADRTPDQLAALFGSAFSKAVVALKQGTWQGPIESGLGWHLVYVDAATAGRVPDYAEVDPGEVKAAWIDAQRAVAKARAYAAMRAKYEVVLPDASNP